MTNSTTRIAFMAFVMGVASSCHSLVETSLETSLVIEPRAVVLEPSDTVVFDVQVEDAFGNAVGVEVEWAATGGPVTAEGVYTAGREAGTFRVVASYAGLRDTALIEVGAARVTTVSIVPEQVTMEPLGVAQLSAIALDKHGVVVNEPVTWAVTGGTIDAAGMYRASLTREAILVLATHVSGVTDTASVTVTAPSNWLYPGDDLQAAVDAHAAGTEFLIKTGIHRLQRILPKAGNTFMGEPGAILSGARELTTFSREGSYWTVSGQSQAGARAGVCDSELQNADGSVYTGCQYPEDLFIDDEALFQVTTLGEVQSGTWFFDYVADKVYFADDPTGRRIEISETRTAFDYAADNVTIRDLIVEKYANPAQHGAIHAMSPDNRGVGWVIEANEVRLNHGTGIKVGLTNARISGNNIHHNGQLGIGLLGVGNIVEENTVAFNNTAAYSAFWEAGGTKFARTTDLVVRGNVVHDNIGPGLWTDIDNLNTLYEDNVVRFNAGEGIFHEISYDAIIRNNVVEGNGFAAAGWLYGAGILVAHSPNVEVYGNTVLNNANGIASIQQDRGSGVHGPHITANLWVHDNSVTMTAGVTGLAQDVGDDAIFDARNNRFDRNTYYLGPLPKYFAFANGARTIAEWQAFGHDVNGNAVSSN